MRDATTPSQAPGGLTLAGTTYQSRLLVGTGTVSYTHLTLPTKRIV